jgi:hypothetical protein
MVCDPYQMRTSRCVESSSPQRHKTAAEDLMTSSHLRSTIPSSGPDQGESQQPSKDSPIAPRALQIDNGNQGTSLAGEGKSSAWALPALVPQQLRPAVAAFPPNDLAFQTAAKGHRQQMDDSMTPTRISDNSADVVRHDTRYEAPMGTCKLEQAALVQIHGIAFNEKHGEESEQRVMGHDENGLPREFGSNTLFAYGEYSMPRDMGLDTAGREVEGICSLSADFERLPFASPVKDLQHWYPSDSSDFEMDPNAEVDTEADTSTLMEEDKVRTSWSNTTLDPRLAYRPSPYIQDVKVEQSDIIIDNGLDFVEDSAMGDAEEEHQEVAATVTVAQTVQQPSLEALVIPHVVSNVQLCGSIQMAPLGSRSVHPFQPTMSSNLYTLDRMVPENSSFVQVVPPQEIASLYVSDGIPSSTPMLEVETLKEQGIDISNTSPTPELAVVASHTTSYSSLSPSSGSPSRDGPASISLSTHGTIWEQKRGVEELAVSVGPQASVASIQRGGSPLRYVRISLVM